MDKVTRQCPQTTTFLKRKESRSGIEPRSFRLPAYRLTARPNRLTTFISDLKLTRIRKFISTNRKWTNIALVQYSFIKNIERYGPRVANAYSKCNAFWTQVFKAYDEFHNKIKLTNEGEALSEPICFNQRIRVGNTFLMHKHWIDKGVYCVAHLLNEEGKIHSHIDVSEEI